MFANMYLLIFQISIRYHLTILRMTTFVKFCRPIFQFQIPISGIAYKRQHLYAILSFFVGLNETHAEHPNRTLVCGFPFSTKEDHLSPSTKKKAVIQEFIHLQKDVTNAL